MGIKCIDQRIIDNGCTININARDGSGNIIPTFKWEAGTISRNDSDYIDDSDTYRFNTTVSRNGFSKWIRTYMIETGNFEKEAEI